jgi:hypothetical protein
MRILLRNLEKKMLHELRMTSNKSIEMIDARKDNKPSASVA